MASVKNLTVLTMQQIIPTLEWASAAIAAQLIRGTLSDRELTPSRVCYSGFKHHFMSGRKSMVHMTGSAF